MKKMLKASMVLLKFVLIISIVSGSIVLNGSSAFAWGADYTKRYLIQTLYTNMTADNILYSNWSNSQFQSVVNESVTAGYNTIMINAPWRTFQPYNTGNDNTDFDWTVIDGWMDYVINSTSLKVIVALDFSCFALPSWLDDTDSSPYLALKSDRQVYRETRGGYPRDPALTLNSTYVKQIVDRYVRKLVDHIKTRYSSNLTRVLAFQIAWTPSEEINYMEDTDYSDSDQAAFRTWLQNRYASVSDLNSVWKTSYSSFNEIYLGNYSYQKDVDVQKFRQESMHNFFKTVHDAGNAIDSNFKLAARQGGILGTADYGIVDQAYFTDIIDWWFTDNVQNRYTNTDVIYDYLSTIARLENTLWGDEVDPLEHLFNNGWQFPLPDVSVQNPYYSDRGQYIYNHGGNSVDMAHWNEVNGNTGTSSELCPSNWYNTSIWTFQSTLSTMAASNASRNSNTKAIYYSPWTNIKDAIDVKPEPLVTKITNDTVEWNKIKAKKDALGVTCDIISDSLFINTKKSRLLSYTGGIYVPQATYMTQESKDAIKYAYTNGIPVYIDDISKAGSCDEYGNPSKTLYRTMIEDNENVPYVQQVEDGNGQSKITFSTVSGATSYKVKYGTTRGSYPNNVTTSSSPYTLSGLTNNTEYYFVVTAMNGTTEIGTSPESCAIPSDATRIFADYFDNGISEWVGYAGNWQIENSELSQDQTDLNNKRINLGGKNLSNFTLRFRAKIVDNGGSSDNWTGVILRSQSPSHTFSDSGYMFYIRDNGNAAIYKQGSGDIATAPSIANVHNNYADFRIVMNGNNIKVYVNGGTTPVMDVNDSTYTGGYISIITGNTHSHYDDIVVNSVVSGTDTTAPATISTLKVVDRDSHYTTLQFTAPGDDGTTGTASAYDIRYSTQQITSSNWDSAIKATSIISPAASGTSQYFRVINTDPKGAKLFFAVKAADEKLNWSGVSNSSANDVEFYQATKGFNIETQGLNGWRYRQLSGTTYSDMTFNASMYQWQGSETYVLVGQDNQHPGASYDSVRTWTAPHSGTISIRCNGNIRLGSSSSNGVCVKINQNSSQIWPGAGWCTVTSTTGVDFGILNEITVSEGDTLNFIVNCNGLNSFDTTYWDPIIVYNASTSYETLAPSTINNLSVICSTENSTMLQWTSTGDDYSNGMAAKYDLRYSTSPITDANWASASQVSYVTEPLSPGKTERFTVPGLNEDTDYYFAIKARDELSNWSSLSNVVSSRTRAKIKSYGYYDFGRIQGGGSWRYQQYDGTTFTDLSYFDISNNRWRRDDSLNLVGPDWQWPGTSLNSVRTWVAPANGTIKIESDGNVKLNYSSGTDGTRVKVLKNTTQLWPSSGWQSITNTTGVSMGVLSSISVSQGDKIYFIVDKNSNNDYDSTTWKPVITYTSGGPTMTVHRASTGFSSVQGELKWNYEVSNGSSMTWDSTNLRWNIAGDTYCLIGINWQHPGSTYDSVRKWTAPSAGTVSISGNMSLIAGGDGVRVMVTKNGTQVWPASGWQSVSAGGSVNMNLNVSVSADDVIKFICNMNGNNSNDTTT